jgi:hypothetical protein
MVRMELPTATRARCLPRHLEGQRAAAPARRARATDQRGQAVGAVVGHPNAVKLQELDVICVVLGCGVEELLLPEPEKVTKPAPAAEEPAAATGEARRAVTPRPRTGRSLPPR